MNVIRALPLLFAVACANQATHAPADPARSKNAEVPVASRAAPAAAKTAPSTLTGDAAVQRWRKLLLDHLGANSSGPSGDFRGDFDGDGRPDAALFDAGALFVSTGLESADPSWIVLAGGDGTAPRVEPASQLQPTIGHKDGTIAGDSVFVFGHQAPVVVYFETQRKAFVWTQLVHGLDASMTDARKRFPHAFGITANSILSGDAGGAAMDPFAAPFVGDFDGDSRLDLVVIARGEIWFYPAGQRQPKRQKLAYGTTEGARGHVLRMPGRSYTPIDDGTTPEKPVDIRTDTIAMRVPGVSSVELVREGGTWRTAFTSD